MFDRLLFLFSDVICNLFVCECHVIIRLIAGGSSGLRFASRNCSRHMFAVKAFTTGANSQQTQEKHIFVWRGCLNMCSHKAKIKELLVSYPWSSACFSSPLLVSRSSSLFLSLCRREYKTFLLSQTGDVTPGLHIKPPPADCECLAADLSPAGVFLLRSLWWGKEKRKRNFYKAPQFCLCAAVSPQTCADFFWSGKQFHSTGWSPPRGLLSKLENRKTQQSGSRFKFRADFLLGTHIMFQSDGWTHLWLILRSCYLKCCHWKHTENKSTFSR